MCNCSILRLIYTTSSSLLGKLILSLFLITLVTKASSVNPVHAQTPEPSDISQIDLDGDGQPDMTTFSIPIATPSDRVRVYDGAGNMKWGDNWQEITDFTDDTWIFEVPGDGRAQIVLRFSQDADTTIAEIFTDQNGDSIVDLVVDGTNVIITESSYPAVRVIVQGDWFLPSGELNWNVRFETDGPIMHLHTYNITDIWLRNDFLRYDGSPDAELLFEDRDRNGIPEYGIWRLLAPTPESWGSVRTWIWSNKGNRRPIQPDEQNYFLWPYLYLSGFDSHIEDGRPVPIGTNYFDAPPGLSVAFSDGSIRNVFFPGYPIEDGFHVHTLEYFESKSVNYANFENAQAYYDLADDKDGQPELHIRHRYFGARDHYTERLEVPENEIRWSWNQSVTDELSWDYKLGLAGRYPITTTARVGDFEYLTIPYSQLPNWVLNHEWDYATFVAHESDTPFLSTEGIYAWGALEYEVNGDPSALSRYLAGEIVLDPDELYREIGPGWRGEFSPDFRSRPLLYVSPVDHKLHLINAQHGVWELGPDTLIRYENLDGDAYLDSWQYYENDLLLEALYYQENHLVYAGPGGIRVKQVATDATTFTISPPTTHQQWLNLGERLQASDPSLQPSNFSAMVDQFQGRELDITGGTLRNFRTIRNGFRFELLLDEGFQIAGSDLVGIAGLEPGEYVVLFENGKFRTEIHTPAQVGLAFLLPGNTRITIDGPAHVAVRIGNTGLEDVSGLKLIVEAISPQGESTEILDTNLAAFGNDQQEIGLDWQPKQVGIWKLNARLIAGSGEALAEATTSIRTTSNLETNSASPLLLSTGSGRRLPVAIILFGFALLVYMVGTQWHSSNEETR